MNSQPRKPNFLRIATICLTCLFLATSLPPRLYGEEGTPRTSFSIQALIKFVGTELFKHSVLDIVKNGIDTILIERIHQTEKQVKDEVNLRIAERDNENARHFAKFDKLIIELNKRSTKGDTRAKEISARLEATRREYAAYQTRSRMRLETLEKSYKTLESMATSLGQGDIESIKKQLSALESYASRLEGLERAVDEVTSRVSKVEVDLQELDGRSAENFGNLNEKISKTEQRVSALENKQPQASTDQPPNIANNQYKVYIINSNEDLDVLSIARLPKQNENSENLKASNGDQKPLPSSRNTDNWPDGGFGENFAWADKICKGCKRKCEDCTECECKHSDQECIEDCEDDCNSCEDCLNKKCRD